METPQGSPQPSSQNYLKQLEDFFNTYCHVKAPFHLPTNAKEFIVKFSPWITLIFIIIAIPVFLSVLALNSFVAPFVALASLSRSGFYFIHLLLILATFILQIVALPGLFKRSLKSWYLVYYASLITAVSNLISFDIISLVIGTAISMFILFEVKEYYK